MSKHRLFTKNNCSDIVTPNSSFGRIDDKACLSTASDQVKNIKLSTRTGSTVSASTPKLQMSDSDSDMDIKQNFFRQNGNMKLPYSREEDEEILRFILKGQNIFKASSISIWKQLEEKKSNPFRTYQSLKNRFLRNIRPNLFTTFRYMIHNEETEQMILEKFPELKRSLGRMNTIKKLELPSRTKIQNDFKGVRKCDTPTEMNLNESLAVNTVVYDNINFNYTEDVKNSVSLPKLPVPLKALECGKQIRFGKSNTIVVTVKNNVSDGITQFDQMTIYEKYLQLKMKNRVRNCRYCGRGEPEPDPTFDSRPQLKFLNTNDSSDSDSDSGSESDVVIVDSCEQKKVPETVTLKEERVTPPSSVTKNPTDQIEKPDEMDSPSLLKDCGNKERTNVSKSEAQNSIELLTPLSKKRVDSDRKRDLKSSVTKENATKKADYKCYHGDDNDDDDDDDDEDYEIFGPTLSDILIAGKRLNDASPSESGTDEDDDNDHNGSTSSNSRCTFEDDKWEAETRKYRETLHTKENRKEGRKRLSLFENMLIMFSKKKAEPKSSDKEEDTPTNKKKKKMG